MTVMVKMNEIYIKDRPREKLIKFGASRLSDRDLLAVLIGSGSKEIGVLDLSRKILKEYSLKKLTDTPLEKLLLIKGLGKVSALRIVALSELAKRVKDKAYSIVYSPKDIWRELENIRSKRKEHFVIFCLDSRNKIIKKEIVSIGTLNSSLVHPREVFEPAIKFLSAQIVISHNHPSGDVHPSDEDIQITKKLLKAGNLLGIEVIDHVIVSNDKFLSLKEKGLL